MEVKKRRRKVYVRNDGKQGKKRIKEEEKGSERKKKNTEEEKDYSWKREENGKGEGEIMEEENQKRRRT